MLGYSSVMHMGYIFLGIASANILGTTGAAILMFAHGLSIALLFAITGEIRKRVPSLDFDAMGGLAKQMPLAAFAFGLGAFAAIGLPGFANFAAEIMVIFGAFRNGFDDQHFHIFQWATLLALWGVVLSAVYMLRAYRRTFFGSSPEPGIAISDIRSAFRFPIALLVSAPLWNFYSADALSLFFKRIALATTAGVLVMMLDFAPSVLLGVPAATPQSGLGEFFTLPLFTCAGLMWMASAIDFVLIFVSLELVTISFYVLVGFTRRNPASLEAAVKYLVLSAIATGFLVYGITWIFGATGETNLQKIATVFSRPELEQNAALFGGVLVIVALGFKIAAVPFH